MRQFHLNRTAKDMLFHTHLNTKNGPDEPIFIVIPGLTCTSCQNTKKVGKSGETPRISPNSNSILPTNKKVSGSIILAPVINSKVKPGSVGYALAIEFLRLARIHGNIVTYEQTTKLCPAYPGDPALWAREMGAIVVTDRKNKLYRMEKDV